MDGIKLEKEHSKGYRNFGFLLFFNAKVICNLKINGGEWFKASYSNDRFIHSQIVKK
jgi:hypothetical protein